MKSGEVLVKRLLMEALRWYHQMPTKKQKKSKDADEKKVRKKGKAMVAGGSIGTGHQEPSSDSGDPELDIDRAMMMKAKPHEFQTTAPSSRQIGFIKPKPKKPPDALTAAGAASATAAAANENTTGSQHQSQDQDPAKQLAQKRLRKKGPSCNPLCGKTECSQSHDLLGYPQNLDTELERP